MRAFPFSSATPIAHCAVHCYSDGASLRRARSALDCFVEHATEQCLMYNFVACNFGHRMFSIHVTAMYGTWMTGDTWP